METDERVVHLACEDTLVVIGDIASSGRKLQEVLATGLVSMRVADVCGELFTEIADLAGAVELPTADNDT